MSLESIAFLESRPTLVTSEHSAAIVSRRMHKSMPLETMGGHALAALTARHVARADGRRGSGGGEGPSIVHCAALACLVTHALMLPESFVANESRSTLVTSEHSSAVVWRRMHTPMALEKIGGHALAALSALYDVIAEG